MPTINRIPKTPRKTENSEKRQERQKFYNTAKWQKLRLVKLANNPLCEICLVDEKLKFAEDVHHIISFMDGADDNAKKALFFDINNLQSLCKQCHQKQHN